MLPKILSNGRYLVLLPVIASFLAAIGTAVWGFVRMLSNVAHLLESLAVPAADGARQGVHMIAVLDAFLLSVVLYIFAIALYELFIGTLAVPAWLVIKNLDGLKIKLISVIIMVMAVTFVEHLVEWKDPHGTLLFGGATALVVAALVLYSRYMGGKGGHGEEGEEGETH